jgi:hypothetical protein
VRPELLRILAPLRESCGCRPRLKYCIWKTCFGFCDQGSPLPHRAIFFWNHPLCELPCFAGMEFDVLKSRIADRQAFLMSTIFFAVMMKDEFGEYNRAIAFHLPRCRATLQNSGQVFSGPRNVPRIVFASIAFRVCARQFNPVAVYVAPSKRTNLREALFWQRTSKNQKDTAVGGEVLCGTPLPGNSLCIRYSLSQFR